MSKLDGQRALITGAGSGIGREIGLALVREGAKVAFEDLDGERAKQALADAGGQGIALAGDVSDSATVADWFAHDLDDFAKQMLIGGIPMGRMATADEIVPTALLLVDPANGFMTGQIVSPNGGEVMN